MNIFDPLISGSLSVSGSAEISGDLTVKGTINATVSGTSSNAISASHAAEYLLTSSFEDFTGSYTTGSFTGSFSGVLLGDGTGITGIPASGVTGLNLSQITDGLATASISDADGFRVNRNVEITGSLVVDGPVTATGFFTQIVSSSIIYESGSTKFGDTQDDSHDFTGSVNITGSISLNGQPIGTGKLDETTFNIYTSSNDDRVDSLETESGSIRTDFNIYTSSNDDRVDSLETKTGSLDGNINTINGRLTSLEVNSGSQAGEIGDLQTFQNTVESGLEFTGSNVTIKGDFLVKGTETRVNSTTVEISDNIISLNGSGAANAGLEVRDVTSPGLLSGSLIWDSANNYWKAGTRSNEERILLDSDLTTLDGRLDSLESATTSYLTTSTTFGGDVSGTYNNISVSDNSHNHTIYNISNSALLFNNMGDSHSTRTAFDSGTMTIGHGWRYIRGSTNGPSLTSTQYYSLYVGLGSEYPATGTGSFGMQIAFPRNPSATYPKMAFRWNESNSVGAWKEIGAAYADDSDKWDGNQFSTYLNQAVLTTSSPTFANITATSNQPNIYLKESDTQTHGRIVQSGGVLYLQSSASGYTGAGEITFGSHGHTTEYGRFSTSGDLTITRDFIGKGLYINSGGSAVSGTQVAIVQDGNQNLQRWGSATTGADSYRFRIDQTFKFIANDGTVDNLTIDSADGSITAKTIVKDGGTASQFLMADGSVSTNPGWITGYTETQTLQDVTDLGANTTNAIGSDLFRGYTYSANSFLDFDDDNGIGKTNTTTLASVGDINFIVDSNDNGTDSFNFLNGSTNPQSGTTFATISAGGLSVNGDIYAHHQAAEDATTKAEMLSYSVASFRPHSTNSGTLAIAQVDSGNSVGMQFTNGAGTANWDISLQPFGGGVGINTVAPGGALHVYSGTSERFLISGDVHVQGSTDLNINGASRRLSFTSGTGTVRTTTANNLYLQTNSTTAIDIDSNQKVLVGPLLSSNNISTLDVVHLGYVGAQTGAFRIKLPGTHSGNWSMIVLEITVYEYNSNEHCVYHVSGHDWTTGWYNAAVTKIGTGKDIRFGYDANEDVILIGDTTSTWSYPHVTVRVMAHPSFYSGNMDLRGDWAISLITDDSGYTINSHDNRLVWNSSNDGSGSGLDADKVDGLQATSFLRSDADDSFSGNLTSGGSSWIKFYHANQTDSNDGKIGSGVFDSGLNIVGTQTVEGTGRQVRVWGSLITSGDEVYWHSGNDGAGSGLDADLLDGVQLSRIIYDKNLTIGAASSWDYTDPGMYAVASATSFTGTNNVESDIPGIYRYGVMTVFESDGEGISQLYTPHTGNKIAIRTGWNNGSWYPWQQIWTSTSDGAGSGLDADLWDGNQFSTYLNQAVLTTSSPTFANITNSGVYIANASQTRDKIRVWNNGAYTIGMGGGYTFGGLNDYAMTFQMNTTSNRGFWWGNDGHSNAQGAMSLTTDGRLVIASTLKVGGGQSDTNSATYNLDVIGTGYASSDFRAPIFYDSGNTSYYMNLDSTSHIYRLYDYEVASNNLGSGYYKAAIQVREYNFGGAQTDSWTYAPRIAFHWGGRVASQIAMNSGGDICLLDNPGTGYENFRANYLYGSRFYDINNNAYYLDLDSTSFFNTVNSNNTILNSGATNKYGFWGSNTLYTIGMSVYSDSTNGGRLDTTSDYNMYFTMSGGTNRGFVFRSSNAAASAIAQIDSNGNIYGNSFTNKYIASETIRVLSPGGGARKQVSYSETGAIKITLPVSWTNTMLRFTVKIYENATGESFDVICAGYNYSTGWFNVAAYIIGQPGYNRNFNVRFGHDGSKCCIYIGELASAWSYPQISVTDFQAGYSGYNTDVFNDGWDIDIVTSFGTIYTTVTNTQIGRYTDALTVTGTITETSSRNIKENILVLDNPLEKINKLRGINYNKIGDTKREIGVIAEEVAEVYPELVEYEDDEPKSVSYSRLTAVLLESIKEQQKQIDELKKLIE